MSSLTPIERSATRAAASDFINAYGLAAPGLDPEHAAAVVAERAATVLSFDRTLGAPTTADEIETWGRHYRVVLEGLRDGNLSDRLLSLTEIETRGYV